MGFQHGFQLGFDCGQVVHVERGFSAWHFLFVGGAVDCGGCVGEGGGVFLVQGSQAFIHAVDIVHKALDGSGCREWSVWCEGWELDVVVLHRVGLSLRGQQVGGGAVAEVFLQLQDVVGG